MLRRLTFELSRTLCQATLDRPIGGDVPATHGGRASQHEPVGQKPRSPHLLAKWRT